MFVPALSSSALSSSAFSPPVFPSLYRPNGWQRVFCVIAAIATHLLVFWWMLNDETVVLEAPSPQVQWDVELITTPELLPDSVLEPAPESIPQAPTAVVPAEELPPLLVKPAPPPPRTVPPADAAATAQEELRQEMLKRIQNQAAATTTIRTAKPPPAKMDNASSEDAAYNQQLGVLLRDRVFFDTTPYRDYKKNPTARFVLRVDKKGSIQSSELQKSSGIAGFDDAILQGLRRLARLPAKSDGSYPPEVYLDYRMFAP